MPNGLFASRFSISDLENLSGVKAHTIRVWERRYGLVRPSRTDTNIRHYNTSELQDLLNISFLNNNGVKISHIAAMSQEAREHAVRETGVRLNAPTALLNELLIHALRFDEARFEDRCDAFAAHAGFRALAEQVFLPLMHHIGLLWQSKRVRPAQEHFVSNLVRRHIEAETHRLPAASTTRGPVHVLYLREGEIHELGLLYANYLLRSAGKHVIYLGQSVPMEDLDYLLGTIAGEVILLTVLTTNFDGGTARFLERSKSILTGDRVSHWITGAQAVLPEGVALPPRTHLLNYTGEMMPLLVG